MKNLRRMAVAFSLYSRIPMPVFKWDESDYKHNLIFFPLIGVCLGIISWGAFALMYYLGLPLLARTVFMVAIPLIVTGGFHVDGFMDVEDALRSYASPEKKLEILKDPHIGAFAVIGLIKIGLLFVGFMAVILNSAEYYSKSIMMLSLIYVMSRCLCGVISLTFKHAKKDGMLNMETKASDKFEVIILAIETAICLAGMLIIDIKITGLISLVMALYIFYYRNKCYKNFAGISGDMAGYFVVASESLMLMCIAIATVLF